MMSTKFLSWFGNYGEIVSEEAININALLKEIVFI